MNIENVTQVVQRIQTIEQRIRRASGSDSSSNQFAHCLAKAQNKAISRSEQIPANNIKSLIRSTANRYGVDPKLAIAIGQAESGLNSEAVSDAGAVGVMQLMPETAKDLGVANIRDTKDNIDGGVRYLRHLLTSFNGDVVRAVAAYNAGPQAVNHYQGVPPYPETQAYVAKVLQLRETN